MCELSNSSILYASWHRTTPQGPNEETAVFREMGAESGVGVGKGKEGVHGDGVVCFVYPFVKNQKAGMFALAYWELALPCRPKAGNNLVDHQSITSLIAHSWI